MASLEGAGPLLSPLENDEKLTNMKQSKKNKDHEKFNDQRQCTGDSY